MTDGGSDGILTLALRFAYDGTAFDAYARDPGLRTVEGELLRALRHEGYVEGSFRTGSRTDAGVSALENVARASLRRAHLKGLVPALQSRLPGGLWATGATQVPDGWNPRRAGMRQYRYDALRRGENEARLRAACSAFEGRNDVRAFARLQEGRTPVRYVESFTVERDGELWSFRVRGHAFLWNQVRRMVSAALAVGRGEAEAQDIRQSLESGRPHPRFRLATAAGLVLERVEYPDLVWDPEAGRLGPDRITEGLQSAAARMRLMGHLRSVAPWPAGNPPTGSA